MSKGFQKNISSKLASSSPRMRGRDIKFSNPVAIEIIIEDASIDVFADVGFGFPFS
jgi:hypothetical protein